MKRIMLLFAMLYGIMSVTLAQVEDVTLVVSGEGVTKDEATTKALRSAIEQAFGVFVSANTEILNDELVKDEIATVSSGNIKKYTELGAVTKPNGNTEVTLQAMVSVSNLTSYSRSHGSSCEFAGSTFAANMKLIELNRENTKKAFENLYKQINDVGNELLTCEIETNNIKADGRVDITLACYTNEKAVAIGELVLSTLKALSIPESMVKAHKQQGIKLYQYFLQYGDCDNRILYYKQESVWFYYQLKLPTVLGRLYDVYDNLGNKYETYYYSIAWGSNRLFNKVYYENAEDPRFCIDIQQQFDRGNGWFIKQTPYDRIDIPFAYLNIQPKKEYKFDPRELFQEKLFIKIPPERLGQITNLYVK